MSSLRKINFCEGWVPLVLRTRVAYWWLKCFSYHIWSLHSISELLILLELLFIHLIIFFQIFISIFLQQVLCLLIKVCIPLNWQSCHLFCKQGYPFSSEVFDQRSILEGTFLNIDLIFIQFNMVKLRSAPS